MQVVEASSEDVEALHAIYCAQVALVPHCQFASDFGRFRDDLLGLSPPLSLFDQVEESQTLVAKVEGRPQGFATFVTYRAPNADDVEVQKQTIAGLFIANEKAGHALLDACEAMASGDELRAFPVGHGRTPYHTYNVGWDGLSDRVSLVPQLLAKRGYKPTHRELHLSGPLPTAVRPMPALPQGISIVQDEVPSNPDNGIAMRAIVSEARVGICLYTKLSLLTDSAAADRIGYIEWLHVEEEYRQQGIARAMMTATLNELVANGCTSWWLTTAADNWRAQALYLSLDFVVVDCSTNFRKQLKA